MLTADDTPTIRFAINRRLDAEPGVRVIDIKFRKEPGVIAVHLELTVGGALSVNSDFHLPDPFELGHLHNEIDEVAEACKQARLDFWRNGRVMAGRKELAGTGLRGRWARYG